MHSIRVLIRSIFARRQLIREMGIRNLRELNEGALLGYLWLVISPLLQVTVYVFVVMFAFGKGTANPKETLHYTLYVLSGMIPWQIMSKVLQEAPTMIRSRMDVVKQLIFPIEILPLVQLIVNSVGIAVTLLVYLIVASWQGQLYWSILLLPVPCFLMAVFLIGASWAISIAGILVKDLREMIAVVFSLLVYLSPVVSTERLVGSKLWSIIMMNPLAHAVMCFRDVLQGEFHPLSWQVFGVMSVASFLVGAWIIQRSKVVINEYI